MSRRVSLKEFQEGLASRLKAAASEAAPSARLGFESGGAYWLARLDSSGLAGVPLVENKPLARALYAAVDIGDQIPQEYWELVSRILAEIYKLSGKASVPGARAVVG